MQFYRRTLALPGVRTLLVLAFFARIPATAAGMVLTLHIAVTMDRGYGAAGIVGAVATIGIALGAPVLGRVVDRYGLRPMLVITTIGEATFWAFARFMPYPMLLVCGFLGGMLRAARHVHRQAGHRRARARRPAADRILDGLGVDRAVVHGRARSGGARRDAVLHADRDARDGGRARGRRVRAVRGEPGGAQRGGEGVGREGAAPGVAVAADGGRPDRRRGRGVHPRGHRGRDRRADGAQRGPVVDRSRRDRVVGGVRGGRARVRGARAVVPAGDADGVAGAADDPDRTRGRRVVGAHAGAGARRVPVRADDRRHR